MNAGQHSRGRRTRQAFSRLRAASMMAACLACIAHTAFAHSSAPAGLATDVDQPLSRLRLPDGTRWTMLADRVWIYGQPAQILVFDAPQSTVELIREISRQLPALVDLTVLAGRTILSGEAGQTQWLAQLQGTQRGGTAGTIATLHRPTSASGTHPAWLSEGWRLRLDVAAMDAGSKVWDRIWQHALPPQQVAARLETALRHAGWTLLTDAAMPQSWARQQERMQVLLMPLGPGSALQVREWTQ